MTFKAHTAQKSNTGHAVVCDEPQASTMWLWLAAGVFMALIVPYATNFIQWSYKYGYFPLRPSIYLMGVCFCCVAVTAGRRPDFSAATLLILLFHGLYILDSLVLHRYDHPSGKYYPLMTHGALLLGILSIAWYLGVIHRLSSLPILLASASVVMICSLVNFAEWFGVHEFTEVTGRAAGFHEDPNNSAIAIVLGLAIFLTYSKNVWLSLGLIALSFVAVALTLSRSGIIAEILVSATYVCIAYRKKPRIVLQALAVMVPVVIAGIFYVVSNMSSEALRESDIQDRLGALMGKDSEKMASGERMKDLHDGLQAIRSKPVIGHGVGAGTAKWQPHNQIVSIWIDGGIVLGGFYFLILGSLAVKCFAAKGRGILCFLAVVIFIPFSQLLHTSMAYWATCIMLINLTSTRFIALQWFSVKSSSQSPTENSTLSSVH